MIYKDTFRYKFLQNTNNNKKNNQKSNKSKNRHGVCINVQALNMQSKYSDIFKHDFELKKQS